MRPSPERPRTGWPGVGPEDVDICEFYDCYTYTVLRTIEDYGLAKPGEAIGLYPEDPADP